MPSPTYSPSYSAPTAAARWATARSPDRPTYGAAADALATALGTPLLPWQRQVADVALELAPDGSWFFRDVLLSTPRQSGKTTLLGPVFLHRCLTVPGAQTWLTAQRRQAARDTWLQVVQRVRQSALGPRAQVRESNGGEALTVPGGGTFRVFAPAEDALHGTANAAVAVDEAWSFSAQQGAQLLQAILPTFSTTGGQLWVVSTAGTADSAWLRGMVDAGRAAVDSGRRAGTAYFEWSLSDDAAAVVEAGLGRDATPLARRAALDAVEAAHPAAGHTLRRDALEQAMSRMAPGEFLRAYGNRWTEASESEIPGHVWARQRAVSWPQPAPGQLALGYDVALDRSDAAVAAAWRGPDGTVRVDLIDHRAGAGWLPARLGELAAAWRPVGTGHDRGGPAQDIADQAKREGLALVPTTAREYAAACAAFLAAVLDGRLLHPGAPSLDRAVAVAATRPLGDAWAWSRRGSSASISPLVAATVALWALDHSPPPTPAPVIYAGKR